MKLAGMSMFVGRRFTSRVFFRQPSLHLRQKVYESLSCRELRHCGYINSQGFGKNMPNVGRRRRGLNSWQVGTKNPNTRT